MMTEQQEPPPDEATSVKYWLELIGPGESTPLKDYVDTIANKKLRKYRNIVQWGKKQGQTYFTHVLDGVMMLGRLSTLAPLSISDVEARCLFLAYTVHDLNKVEAYGGKTRAYVDIATDENIATELENLEASAFFADWRAYLRDIGELARLHQGHIAQTNDGIDRRKRLLLDEQTQVGRVRQLGRLIQAVDALALSGTLDERANKDKFLVNLNAACPSEQYCFVTHRLGEYRGILSNVIHNCVVGYLRERYPASLDLLYYPDGVAYLLPKRDIVSWDDADVVAVAERLAQRLAEIQANQLGQFIKPSSSGIAVDEAAIESGATAGDLLGAIYSEVARKRYKADREAKREADVRKDLSNALDSGKVSPELASHIKAVLASPALLPRDEAHIRCGEYATAFRKLISDHSDALGLRLSGGWEYLYQVLELPRESWPIYNQVNSYRRGFFVVRDLPEHLADVDALHERFLSLLIPDSTTEIDTNEGERSNDAEADAGSTSLAWAWSEYLRRTLLVSFAAVPHDFSSYLRQYVTARNRQCCNCSTLLPTQEWMEANAPKRIGVQGFSNRLSGGALRDPKRQICPVCRAQFILEKIGWHGHRDKWGQPKRGPDGKKTPGYTTFYLYLYPRGYFTEPFLQAWSAEIERLRDQDSTAFLINLSKAFSAWASGDVGSIPIYLTKVNGVALPGLSEATSNIPILPINAPGQNYGEQFLVALEKAVLLRNFFGCRVILSRLPVPPVDAKGLQALFVDGAPRNLLWLLTGAASGEALYESEANLTDEQTADLEQRLQRLFQLRDAIRIQGSDRDLVHELAVEAGDDSLRLYHALNRIIEEKAAAEGKGGSQRTSGGLSPEARATALSRKIAPIARELVRVGAPS